MAGILLYVNFQLRADDINGTIRAGNTTRNFIVHVPSGLPANPALVISMHGVGSSPSEQRTRSGFNPIADREKFIVVYPQGIFQSIMPNGWDVAGTSDVNFISALIDTLIERYKIDPNAFIPVDFQWGA
jgi:poly(3-hydroxybutyrate) depolymerase